MTDKNQLPDWRDEEALAKWLEQFPRPLIAAFACRMALLALPGLSALTAQQLKNNWALTLVTSAFRGILASWVAAKFPTQDASRAARAAAVYATAAAHAARRVAAAARPADAARANDAAFATYSARAASAAADDDTAAFAARASFWLRSIQKIRIQSESEMNQLIAARQHEDPAAWYLSQPLFETQNDELKQFEPFARLLNSLPETGYWDVWFGWVQQRYLGKTDWPKPVYDELIKWRAEWDRPPGEVNRDIAALLAKHQPKTNASTSASASGAAHNWDFFLSYSNVDAAAARKIDDILTAQGYRVFFQEREMLEPGNYLEMMERGLKQSRRLIALLSKDYQNSPPCFTEWSVFFDREAKGERGLIVQLLLRDEVEKLVMRVHQYHPIKGLDGANLQAAVLRAIGHKGR
jgi:hypothetical protein